MESRRIVVYELDIDFRRLDKAVREDVFDDDVVALKRVDCEVKWYVNTDESVLEKIRIKERERERDRKVSAGRTIDLIGYPAIDPCDGTSGVPYNEIRFAQGGSMSGEISELQNLCSHYHCHLLPHRKLYDLKAVWKTNHSPRVRSWLDFCGYSSEIDLVSFPVVG